MTVESYTGVHGVLSVDAVAKADVIFSIEITRGVASAKRSGKWSDIQRPGKLAVKGTIDEIVTNGTLIGYVVGDTEVSGTAVDLHAGLSAPGSGEESITDMTTPSCTTASLVRITALTAAVTGAGYAILHGTDASGNVHSEQVQITTLEINGYVTSNSTFLTVTRVVLMDVVAVGATLKIHSVVGATSIVVGDGKIFDLIGMVEDGGNNVAITANNSFLTSGKLEFDDSETIVRNPASFTMQDPDADLEVDHA